MKNLFLLFLFIFSTNLRAVELSPEIQSKLSQSIHQLETIGDPVDCQDPQIVKKGKTHSIVCANGNEAELSVLSEDEVNLLFHNLKNSGLPFAYPEDGCYARAHKMCMLMDRKGIKSAKIFVEGALQVQSDYAVGRTVNWWYHVAPIVLMKKKNGDVEPVVIDPSIMQKAAPVEEWVGTMTKCSTCKREKQYFTAKFNYFPHNKLDKAKNFQQVKEMEQTLKDYKVINDHRIVSKKKASEEKK